MGQKIHPVGFRLGITRGHDSHWYFPKKQFRDALESDYKLRKDLKDRIGKGLVSRIEIERAATRVKVTIYTSRPGAVIGKGGKGIDQITSDLNKALRKENHDAQVQVNVTEVRQPELDAQLVAENIAVQLERRISHRRAMRQSMTRAQRMNCRGMKIKVSGRLNGSDIARTEGDMIGKIPLHTLRADIDYGVATAATVAGAVGIKVWVYRGEILPDKQLAALNAAQDEVENRRRRDRDERRSRSPRPQGEGRGGWDRGGDRPPRPEGADRGPRPEGGYRGGDRGPRPEGGYRGPRPEGGAPRPEGGYRGPRPEGGAPRPEGGYRGPRPEGGGPRPEGGYRGPRPEGGGPRPEGGFRGPRPEGGAPRPEGGFRGPRPEGGFRGPRPEGGGPRPEGGFRGPRPEGGPRSDQPKKEEN